MMKKLLYLSLVVFTTLLFGSGACATGKPLVMSDLDEVGWDNTTSFQCYLSSALKLEKLPDDDSVVSFDKYGNANVRDSRGTIELPVSLAGRIVKHNKRDQYLYVAFEEGDATLPFALGRDGKFNLMYTVDEGYQKGVRFVEYEGIRYKPVFGGQTPHLNVVINRTQSETRRQMQGIQARAASSKEDAAKQASEEFLEKLTEDVVVAIMGIASEDTETAKFIQDELQHLLVNAKKFTVLNRDLLDAVYAERNFQYSGEVSDSQIIDMGKMSGATVVIAGDISGTGKDRRLNLKAIDLLTGTILAYPRVEF
jgi:hypothetical protein